MLYFIPEVNTSEIPEAAGSEHIPVAGYSNRHEGVIPESDPPAGSEVAVGICVKCRGTGKGAGIKIDAVLLNSVQ